MSSAALGIHPPSASAGQGALRVDVDTAVVVIKSNYRRFSFDVDIRRLAVGDTDILTAELISSREVLVLGRQTGRTTVIVWLADGTSREISVAVQRDLAVLGRALTSVASQRGLVPMSRTASACSMPASRSSSCTTRSRRGRRRPRNAARSIRCLRD